MEGGEGVVVVGGCVDVIWVLCLEMCRVCWNYYCCMRCLMLKVCLLWWFSFVKRGNSFWVVVCWELWLMKVLKCCFFVMVFCIEKVYFEYLMGVVIVGLCCLLCRLIEGGCNGIFLGLCCLKWKRLLIGGLYDVVILMVGGCC